MFLLHVLYPLVKDIIFSENLHNNERANSIFSIVIKATQGFKIYQENENR